MYCFAHKSIGEHGSPLQLFCSILKNQHPFGVYRKGVFICQNVDLVFISKTQLRAGLIFFVGVMKALCL